MTTTTTPTCKLFVQPFEGADVGEAGWNSWAEAIKLAQNGKSDEISCPEFCRPNFELLEKGVRPMFTLTKTRGCRQQFRAWATHPNLWKAGSHADGFGDFGLFEAYGTLQELQEVAERTVLNAVKRKCYRMEDQFYIVWF